MTRFLASYRRQPWSERIWAPVGLAMWVVILAAAWGMTE